MEFYTKIHRLLLGLPKDCLVCRPAKISRRSTFAQFFFLIISQEALMLKNVKVEGKLADSTYKCRNNTTVTFFDDITLLQVI